jgi:hypothetical protein
MFTKAPNPGETAVQAATEAAKAIPKDIPGQLPIKITVGIAVGVGMLVAGYPIDDLQNQLIGNLEDFNV